MTTERFERVERLHTALETLKHRQDQLDQARAALGRAEAAVKLAEVLLATAQREVTNATNANKSDGLS